MMVFASIFGVGFLILLISMMFGSGDDIDADFGGSAELDAGGPNILSSRMASLLMVGFGAVGFGVRATTDATMLTSSLAGVGGAIMVGLAGYFIIRLFYRSQASSTITDADINGSIATVIDAIPKGGQGQTVCVLRGREITFLARSSNGKAIDRGTSVRVVSKTGATVLVEPVV